MKRNASLDIIRGFAVVLVACLHSIGNGSLTANHISGVSGYLLTGLWLLSASCVPLFLMLSGYLQNRKMPTVKYYVNYLHIYIPYLLLGVSLEDRALFLPYCRDGGQYPLFLFQRECCGLSFK